MAAPAGSGSVLGPAGDFLPGANRSAAAGLYLLSARLMPARYLCLRTRHACPYQTAFAMPARGPAAGAHCARVLRQDGFGGGIPLLDAVRAVLAQPTHKVCHGALEALPELMQLGEGMDWGAHVAAQCFACCLLQFSHLSLYPPTSVIDTHLAPPACPAGRCGMTLPAASPARS